MLATRSPFWSQGLWNQYSMQQQRPLVFPSKSTSYALWLYMLFAGASPKALQQGWLNALRWGSHFRSDTMGIWLTVSAFQQQSQRKEMLLLKVVKELKSQGKKIQVAEQGIWSRTHLHFIMLITPQAPAGTWGSQAHVHSLAEERGWFLCLGSVQAGASLPCLLLFILMLNEINPTNSLACLKEQFA